MKSSDKVKLLKSKGWSRDAIAQVYQDITITTVRRVKRVTAVEVRVPCVTDEQLKKLALAVAERLPERVLCDVVGITPEDLVELGGAVSLILEMVERGAGATDINRLIDILGTRDSVFKHIHDLPMSYYHARRFELEVYSARACDNSRQ